MMSPMASGLWDLLTAPFRLLSARTRGCGTRRRERYAATFVSDDWLSTPEELEGRTGISKEEYEWRLLVAARVSVMGEYIVERHGRREVRQGALDRGFVEDVRMEGDGLDVQIVVLFRVDERPGRVFGWRMPVWPTPTPDPEDDYTGPEGWADLLVVELWEDRDLVVPKATGDADADGITWLDR
jgi:hypothetical protein